MYLCEHSLFLGRDKEDMSSLKTGPSRHPFPSGTLAYSGQPGLGQPQGRVSGGFRPRVRAPHLPWAPY